MAALNHPAFSALSPWIDHGLEALTLERLNAYACALHAERPVSERGCAIRFVAARQRTPALGYEKRIHENGEVVTRTGNAHDLFNALCWLAFPRVKRACNAMHVRYGTGRDASQRGPVRDAVTLFDESGVIALSASSALAELLELRQWRALFAERRNEALRDLRFFVCGHALYEKLQRPYAGITARMIVVPVSRDLFAAGIATLRQTADEGASRVLCKVRSPHDLLPLPIAGIPGWDPRNANPVFYDDRSVFRPVAGPDNLSTASVSVDTSGQSVSAPASVSSSSEP